ncbi:PREDICTED: shikimate O-hydroxycinnamoyltransferase [Theobroma cacao]|uniref:Shikimate O-hydroxycinnamoyltransferase n=1 Tax=Theobroma cacao TaxID=3641 RepID=A0AB32W9A2_THECC|nr:PREDICTED: shikimate O-hydroxycinnamoyltransferase [Theobroma cacao]XP_007033665.2 PREDICTED: shikimate O-hydroxycinnamoyltransferase [Theobroma cacao]XP_017975394.1 PREDICTED: shikimate O-hydroxycinnamoyltransferase [Theobroma cacao]XP_017975395.1 PREDICTED: shikimate O-hydroxycinnamoyltransferase [Theobroma cacao]XP_017975396.1 PREDICTED: shikimate O-hydroxycinnamoyltransferase [Theobroma cacao]
MEISIKESTMVRPAQETPNQWLWMSNMDEIVIRSHIPTVYFYIPDGSSNCFDVERLKGSLSRILVPFYPVAGRLRFDENERLELICNAEGVLFIEAETSSEMDLLTGDFTDSSQVWRLVPAVDYSGGISSYPLFILQVTSFKCGGISIGVGVHHSLADGTSALNFINSWSDMARGIPLCLEPLFDRTLLRARVPPTPKFHHIEYEPSPPLITESESHPKSSIVSVFNITADHVNTLKAKSQENIADTSTTKFSTFNVLAAHIWRCVTRARFLSNDQPTKLYMAVDGRSRLHPALPSEYFGNVIFTTATIAVAGDLQSEPITDTEKRIQKALTQMDNEYLRSILDYMELPGVKDLARGSRTIHSPNLGIVSWMRLPIYEADFGWGRPVYMRPAKVLVEGLVYITRTPKNDGSLSVVTRLEASEMKLFGELLYKF